MKICYFLLVVTILCGPLTAQNVYHQHFTGKTLRIDVFQSGDRESENIILDELFQENGWAGHPDHLIDTLNLGHYFLKVFSHETGELLYSQGFGTLFMEWQTTEEALAGQKKVLGYTVRIPFPRDSITIQFFKRDSANALNQLIDQFVIDPGSVMIQKENRAVKAEIIPLVQNGPPATMVDLTILGEGYTTEESDKFKEDLKSAVEILFSVEPYQSLRGKFNIHGVLQPSEQSGVDDPNNGIFVNTAMNFSFNTFGSDRYLMSADNKRINDIISAVPSEVILILVNTAKYGGGGIYNLYSSVAIDNVYARNILVHELGHSFAGLGDEYYTSDIAYYDFYPLDREPWEPNLTILKDPATLKWAHLLSEGIPVPTPWNQEAFDRENDQYTAKYKRLSQSIENSGKLKKLQLDHQDSVRLFFENHPLKNKIGAFEGGGYKSRGIYRPSLDCIMFSNRTLTFDLVCRKAIETRILFYAGPRQK